MTCRARTRKRRAMGRPSSSDEAAVDACVLLRSWTDCARRRPGRPAPYPEAQCNPLDTARPPAVDEHYGGRLVDRRCGLSFAALLPGADDPTDLGPARRDPLTNGKEAL